MIPFFGRNTVSTKSLRDKISSKNTPLSLYNHITRDFVHPGKSDYELLGDTLTRHTREGEIFSAKYDEPTYLTFRVHFHINDDTDDIVDNVNGYKKYDTLPHPLLKAKRSTDASISYSTVDYLRNNLGETVRADLLERFIKELNDIQTYYPYYFTQISGINNYLKIDPKSGRRVKSDARTISIKCNEALDMRITQLVSLYRKIAWDDVYQRWVLPDMMRFFKMDIYISELRVFHRVKSGGTASTEIGAVPTTADIPGKSFTLISDALNEVIPTIKLELEQCEFDISDTLAHLDSFISGKHNEPATPTIKFTVGNIRETHVYGLNKDMEDIIRKANNSNGIPEKIQDNDILSDEILQNYYFFDEGDANTKLETYYAAFNGLKSPSSTKSRGFGKNGLYEDEYTPMDTTTQQQMGLFGNFIKGGINMAADEAKRWTTMGMNKLVDMAGPEAQQANKILMDIAYGNTGSLLKMTRDAIYNSTAAKDLQSDLEKTPDEKKLDSVREALKSTLETIYNNATDKGLPIVKEIKFMIESGMSAADMDRYIEQKYEAELEGTSNEAIDDTDKGYKDPGLTQGGYTSTANNTPYKNQPLMTSPYVSTANENGATPASIQIAPLGSTANSGSVADKFNPSDRGTSNEAIEDLDNGYKNPGLASTPYSSTANVISARTVGLINPKYLSSANNGSAVPANIQIAPLGSTANANSAVPANMQDRGKGSTANENQAVPANVQIGKLGSTANSNGAVPANIQIAPLDSAANNNGVTDNINPADRGTSNEAIEDLDKGYKNPGLINSAYLSTSTTPRKDN